MSFSLIVPIAANDPKYKKTIPHVFRMNDEGVSFCIKSISGLNLEDFNHIYFALLREHDEAYGLSEFLQIQFKRLGLRNAEIVILNHETGSQAETIEEVIKIKGVEGSIFIKDPDSYFDGKIVPQNGIAVYPLEKLSSDFT